MVRPYVSLVSGINNYHYRVCVCEHMAVMAWGGMPDTSVYTISKSTLDAVTKSVANQLKDAQIRYLVIFTACHTQSKVAQHYYTIRRLFWRLHSQNMKEK